MYKLFANFRNLYKKKIKRNLNYEFLDIKSINFNINFYEYFRLSLDERNNYGKSNQIK